jgi:putative PIN family toxin of toxin-antitoxin system
MRVVVDTNVALSGLLWHGPPNQILKWAREGILEVVACEQTTAELRRILQYKRFAQRLSMLEASPAEVFAYFMNLVFFVPIPGYIPHEILQDPFDNIFLALASQNKGSLIISGDSHLLKLKEYQHIQIVTPSEACQIIAALLSRGGSFR